LVRPFTLSRLADIIHLAQAPQGITSDDVEEAMMVTRDRAVELVRQAEEMKLIRPDGSRYYSTNLGSVFFEALRNDDNTKLDNTLSEYPPYLKVRTILSEKSADMAELKGETELTEVAIEIVLRLLRYVHDDLCCINERFFLRVKELPEDKCFLSAVRKTYSELRGCAQWGCPEYFIRVDRIASRVCGELRLPIDDFAKLLNKTMNTSPHIEVHSEVASYQFMPFSRRKLDPKSYRKCYMRLKVKA